MIQQHTASSLDLLLIGTALVVCNDEVNLHFQPRRKKTQSSHVSNNRIAVRASTQPEQPNYTGYCFAMSIYDLMPEATYKQG
eukprot:2048241-Amphidinium_carterae.1